MGIQGLLPFLKDASTQINISEFRNKIVAIDSYCWLHKGAFGCAEKLARGEDTNGYVLYCFKYIKMLQHHNIRPIMVFDGQHLPAKRETETKRREQRQQCKKQAQELLRMGKVSEAYSYVRRSIDITHKMALNLIKECRKEGIDCIVAPYEADAQLAYLNMNNICHAVISEDSDLVLFGCKKIIYKLDLNGSATLVDSERIPKCMGIKEEKFSFDKFRHMCVLSGCDYLMSLPGIGIKKALKFVSMTANPSIYDALPKIPQYLNKRDLEVTDDYRNQFMIADATFRHQVVYDPINRKLIRLTEPNESETKEEYLVNAGSFYDSDLAFKMALGNVDPFSYKELDDWVPDLNNVKLCSIWAKGNKGVQINMNNDKANERPSFDEVVSKEFKHKALSKEEIEAEKGEEESRLEDELKVYMQNAKPKRKRQEEELDASLEAPPSPVMKRKYVIPFKKISKFKRTELNTSEEQLSRFFVSKNGSLNGSGLDDSTAQSLNGSGLNNSIAHSLNGSGLNDNIACEENSGLEDNLVESNVCQENINEDIDTENHKSSPSSANQTSQNILHDRNSTTTENTDGPKRLHRFKFESNKRLSSKEEAGQTSDTENLTPPNSQELSTDNYVFHTQESDEPNESLLDNEKSPSVLDWKAFRTTHRKIIDKSEEKIESGSIVDLSDDSSDVTAEKVKSSKRNNLVNSQQSINSRTTRSTKSVSTSNTKKTKEIAKNQRTILSMFKFSKPPQA